jgi:polar amino acid transport system substrate-binding protein
MVNGKIGGAPPISIRLVAVAAACGIAALGAGCGSASSGSSGASASANAGSGAATAAADASVDQQARKLLPKAVTDRGTLRIATMLDWPPFTYKSPDGNPTGIDIDLVGAISKTLGLKPAITNLADGGWIPGIQNGKFDVAVSQLAISPERAAVVGFVDYIGNPLGLMVRQADTGKIEPADLCGHSLVATTGTGPLSFGRTYPKTQCVAKGKPAIKFQVYGDSGTTVLALANGRGEGFLVDNAVGTYTAKTTKKHLVMDDGIVPGSSTRSGIAFPKQQPQIGDGVRAALVTLAKNGTYQKILDSWGIAKEALTPEQISAAESS